MQTLEEIVATLSGVVWGPIMLTLLVGTGLYPVSYTHLDVYKRQVLCCVEKPMIEYVLNKVGGNQSKAAEMLGLNRNTLRKKMAQYNLQ